MKYTMQLISRDELKQKLERKDQFKLVMALGTGNTVQSISPARCTSPRCGKRGPRFPRTTRLSSTFPAMIVAPVSAMSNAVASIGALAAPMLVLRCMIFILPQNSN